MTEKTLGGQGLSLDEASLMSSAVAALALQCDILRTTNDNLQCHSTIHTRFILLPKRSNHLMPSIFLTTTFSCPRSDGRHPFVGLAAVLACSSRGWDLRGSRHHP